MEVKCTNNKNYNLTIDKVYEVQNEEENFYFVINDNNLLRRYSKELFTEVNVESSLDDIINSLNFIGDTLNLKSTIDGEQIDFDFNISYLEPAMSCGVRLISGIDSIRDEVVEHVPDREGLREGVLIEIIRKVFNKIYIIEDLNFALFIISTTVGSFKSHDCLLENAVENYDYHDSADVFNPNSGNVIRAYFLTADQF